MDTDAALLERARSAHARWCGMNIDNTIVYDICWAERIHERLLACLCSEKPNMTFLAMYLGAFDKALEVVEIYNNTEESKRLRGIDSGGK